MFKDKLNIFSKSKIETEEIINDSSENESEKGNIPSKKTEYEKETVKFVTKKDEKKDEKPKNFSQQIDEKIKERVNHFVNKSKKTDWKELILNIRHINYGEKLKRIYKYYLVIGSIILLYVLYFIGTNAYSFLDQKSNIEKKISEANIQIENIKIKKEGYKTLEIEEQIFKERWQIDLMETFKFRVNNVEVLSKIKEKNNTNSYLVKLNYSAMEKIGQTNLILILMNFKNKIVYADPVQIIFISNDKNN